MKTVQVDLKDGWETELWKLRRLFPGLELNEATDKKQTLIKLPFVCTDPRLSRTGKYGFPQNGFTLEILIPNAYIETGSAANVRMSKFRSNDEDMAGPAMIDEVICSLFMDAIKRQTSLHIFNSMKAVDRALPELWIMTANQSQSLRDEDCHDYEGEKVGTLTISADSPTRISLIEANILCLKCGEQLDQVKLRPFRGAFEEDLVCPTCDRDLCVSIYKGEIHATDCAISNIGSISFWLYCNCGQDCSYYHKALPPGPKNLHSFTCACPVVKPVVHFKCTADLPKRKKPTASPKVGSDSSPVRKFKEGVALPMNGACKHYKKSFRWLQYPCCNEWYACNQCHDSRAPNHDRSEEEATMMMCGFCSTRQNIAISCRNCGKETNPGWSVKERVYTGVKGRRKPRRRHGHD